MNQVTVEFLIAHFNRPITIGDDGCWLWGGALDQAGYARYGPTLVYGIVFRMAGRSCPKHMELCHSCKPKNCINPDHIYTATHKQNTLDGLGTKHGAIKFTAEQVCQVNELLRTGMSKASVARAVGVSPQWINKFIRGEFKYAQPEPTSVQ